MSEVDGRSIKRGLWTNVEQGNVMGKVVTTDSTTGAIVIALMAVLSTMGTSHLWNLLLFILHQIRANGHASDGLYRQQQALLRTLPPPSSLVAESTKLWWHWRKRNDSVTTRSLAQFLLAASCTIGFIAIGISSSFVVSNSDLEVLVHSPLCGTIDPTPPADVSRGYIEAVSAVSTPYAEECYVNQTVLSARCKAFVRPRIDFTTEKTPCPFDVEFCAADNHTTSSAIALDSGLVDLNAGFGFNLPKRDTVKYRRRTICAVLPLGGRTSIVNSSDFPDALQAVPDIPGERLMLIHYGDSPTLGEWKNTTLLYSLLRGNFTKGYQVLSRYNSAAQGRAGISSDFFPLEGMRRSDADVVVKFLASSVHYTQPVDDPWLSAHQPVTKYDIAIGKNITLYVPDSPITGIGCTVQHQFCITTAFGEQCSKLDALPLNVSSGDWKEARPLQRSALQLITLANLYLDLSVIDTVKIRSLMSSDGVVRAQMSSDQWIKEVQRMEAFVYASSQVTISDYAMGPSLRDPGVRDYVISPVTAGDKQLCGSLKMRKAGGFVNVNVFGMTFVIAASLLFAAIDIVLLKFLIYLTKFRQALSPRIERWIQDGVLQLQRRAYEAHGEGTWSGLSKEVPLTETKQLLAELPLESLPVVKSTSVPAAPSATQPNQAQPQVQPPQPQPAALSTQNQGLTAPVQLPQTSSNHVPVPANIGTTTSVTPSAGANGPHESTQQAASTTPSNSTQTQQNMPGPGVVP